MGVYVKKDVIPVAIRQYVKNILDVDLKEYQVEQKGSISIGMPWHEGCSEYYKMFQVVSTDPIDVKPTDFAFSRSGMEGDGCMTGKEIGGSTVIPSGFLMVKVSTYPKNCKIYTADNATKMIPDNSGIDLSDDEILALYYARSLKSFARPKYAEEVYISLQEKKLMSKNKSITTDGKNFLGSEKAKSHLKNLNIHSWY